MSHQQAHLILRRADSAPDHIDCLINMHCYFDDADRDDRSREYYHSLSACRLRLVTRQNSTLYLCVVGILEIIAFATVIIKVSIKLTTSFLMHPPVTTLSFALGAFNTIVPNY